MSRSLKPRKKIAAAGAGGTFAALLVVAAHAVGLDVPLDVAAYIEAGAIAAFASGYAKSDA